MNPNELLGGHIFALRKEFGVEEKSVVGMDRAP